MNRFRASVLILFVVASALMAIHGSRLVFTGDEGILLEPAQRVAMGERPYVDFFAYMSPGSYWIQAIIFKLLGFTMFAGRLMTILDFSLQCALVFWLVARFATMRAASITTALFVVFQIADPSFLTAQHRWDSGALALLSIVLALTACDQPATWRWMLSGGLIAVAVLCTPTVGLVVMVTLCWLFMERRWMEASKYSCGGALVAISAVLFLWRVGNLQGFLDQMNWLRTNYSEVNIVPYGAVIGGYKTLFDGMSGFLLVLEAGLVFCMALPAILPPFAVAANLIQIARGKVEPKERSMLVFLIACTVALVSSSFPRPDVMHLAFVAFLPYVLTGVWISRWCSLRIAGPAIALVSGFAGLYLVGVYTGLAGTTQLPFAVGTLRVPKHLEPELKQLIARVGKQQSLFVHPYMPLFYFLTQATNPTRFAYLTPGLMTSREESMALEDLAKKPPEWVLFLSLSREEFLRVFPNGTAYNEKFPKMEAWLAKNYRQLDPPLTVNGYQLLRRDATPLALTKPPAHLASQ